MAKSDIVINMLVHVGSYLVILGVVASMYECGSSDAGLSWQCFWSNYTLYLEALFESFVDAALSFLDALAYVIFRPFEIGLWAAIYDLVAGTFRYITGA